MAQKQEAHAEECVRLANASTDKVIQAELLHLRQKYLQTASRLREIERQKQTGGN